MSPYLHAMQVLAQGDAGEWMEILFIVVLAVVWGIGGIVKAAGAKAKQKRNRRQGGRAPQEQQPKQPTWLQQLVAKTEEIQRAVEGQPQKRTPPARPAQKPKPAAPSAGQGQIAVRTGRGGQPVLVYERKPAHPTVPPRQPQQAPTQRPQRTAQQPAGRPAPTRTDFPEPIATPERTTRPFRSTTRKAPRQPSIASTIMDQFDPDALRKAILHYEILGKPLALRDPFERNAYS